MFSVYFVFHCLNMFYAEKQVSKFLATRSGYSREQRVLATHFGDLPSREIQSRVYTKWFATHSRLISRLARRETPETAF